MAYGYCARILHVHLDTGRLVVDAPQDAFYRAYLGGSAMGCHFLLKHTPPGADPLGPANTLSLMVGVTTGAAFSGQSRVAATAKSPATGLVGDSQAGGFWPSELKAAGFDGLVVHGVSARPVYLWISDGHAELKDAAGLWGLPTGDVEDAIRTELGDARIQVLSCGPAAEKGVVFGALINSANRANGRTGMGTVMAAKKLKAVAVRGHRKPEVASPEGVQALARWGVENLDRVAGLSKLGTAEGLLILNEEGGLPTRNWSSGVFEGAQAISGETLADTVLKRRDTCSGCAIACKRVVEIPDGPFHTEPRYGGPEYETLAALGSYCGVSDLAAVCRANALCNMHGMDTISCGATIAWAMDCFERGLLTREKTDGIDLRFGSAEAMVAMVEKIARRDGFGRVLGEGSARAAERLNVGRDLVVATKNQEFPAHMPQHKPSLALVYSVNPFGADHQSHEHDPFYSPAFADRAAQLGLLDPQPVASMNTEKLRYVLYTQYFYSATDAVCVCQFVFGPSFQLYSPAQLVEAIRAVTGWDYTLWELMKVGERRLNLLRAYNAREGVGIEADTMPAKLGVPLRGGPTDGVTIKTRAWKRQRADYYRMAGWDRQGRPTRGKLQELGLEWLADELEGTAA